MTTFLVELVKAGNIMLADVLLVNREAALLVAQNMCVTSRGQANADNHRVATVDLPFENGMFATSVHCFVRRLLEIGNGEDHSDRNSRAQQHTEHAMRMDADSTLRRWQAVGHEQYRSLGRDSSADRFKGRR